MTIPHEFLVWQYGAPVICIGVNSDMDVWSLEGINLIIDESYEPDRRRVDIF